MDALHPDLPEVAAPAQHLISRLASNPALDKVTEPMRRIAEKLTATPEREAALQGDWLGHPLHPVLVDLPIGFWTSAAVLDLTGPRTRGAADLMVAAGLLSALPAAASGLADWKERGKGDQRVGAAHAVANTTATVLYGLSLKNRIAGRRLRGVWLGMLGAAAATAGGYLGGHLAFQPGEDATDDPARDIVDQQGAALGELRLDAPAGDLAGAAAG